MTRHPVTDDAFEHHVGRHLVIERHRRRPDNKLAIGSRQSPYSLGTSPSSGIRFGSTPAARSRAFMRIFRRRLNAGESLGLQAARCTAILVATPPTRSDWLAGDWSARDSLTLEDKGACRYDIRRKREGVHGSVPFPNP